MEEIDATVSTMLILDEAHLVKNNKSMRARKLARAEGAIGQIRLLLTATPLQNNLIEFKQLLSMALPGLLEDAHDFRSFVGSIEDGRQPAASLEEQEEAQLNLMQLQQAVEPYLLMRRDQCAILTSKGSVLVLCVLDQRADKTLPGRSPA